MIDFLADISLDLAAIYSRRSRLSIAPERLLRPLPFPALYSIRSEYQLKVQA